MDNFFYHSFPRRSGGHKDPIERGMRILESIFSYGLLLVPEQVVWVDPTVAPPSHIAAIQRRVCFTELAPDQLPEHAKTFGPFALEFSIQSLRSMGAMPVIYIPNNLDPDAAYGNAATSVLAHLAAAQALAAGLARYGDLTAATTHMTLTKKSGEVLVEDFDAPSTSAIRRFTALLEAGQGIPFRDIANALSAAASIFYPTENLTYTGVLAYYRQREWRIFSGSFWNGQPTTSAVTPDQAERLLELDEEFFSRELDFPDGRFSLAVKSHVMSHVQDKPLSAYVRRVIVPVVALQEARSLLERIVPGIEVGAHESD